MPRKPPLLSAALTVLRIVQGWHQKELAAALGCGPPLLSDYEAGRKPLSRERLEEMVAVLGLPLEALDRTLAFVQEVRSLSVPEGGASVGSPQAEAAVVRVRASAEALARSLISLGTEQRAEEERRRAPALWQRLERHNPARRLLLVEGAREFRSWALCELVCELSLKAAADRADRALELAGLSRRIAELAPGEEAWRQRLQGYALAHVANALRVGGLLPAAEEAFARALSLWEEGVEAPRILSEARTLGLGAALRTSQRRLAEALGLIDQALPSASTSEKQKLLLQRERVLNLTGDFEGAISTLREVARLVSRGSEARQLLGVQLNLADNLIQAGRPQEAEALLPELRKLTAQLGNDLDTLRLRWLEGRMAAGLGQRDKALSALSWVREEFDARKIAYDTALATLEIAILYIEEGRLLEVRTLARRLVWVFESQGVHREALAALRLFCEAAEQERASIHLARQLVTFLRHAKGEPSFRFEVS